MHQDSDWITRIIKLESDVSAWKTKFELESLWRKVVEDWVLTEFGFDIGSRVELLEQSLRRKRAIDVSFSTKSSKVDFEQLKNDARTSFRVASNTNKVSSQIVLASLPDTIEVSEVLSPDESQEPDAEQKHSGIGISLEGTDIIEEEEEGEEIDESNDLEYSLEYEPNSDEYDERKAYPLTIYDDDDTMDVDVAEIESHHAGNAGSVAYKAEHLEITEVEPSVVDVDEGSQESQSQNLPPVGCRVRTNKSLIQTLYFAGQKRKFQCRACGRIFNDRGNGHRHVRRMHPGASLVEQRRAEMERFMAEPEPPILEPEISLTEGPEMTQEEYQILRSEDENDDDDEFEDEKEMFQDSFSSSQPPKINLGLSTESNGAVGKLSAEKRNAAAQLIRKLAENQYECTQCNRLFSVSCNARRHVRVVHFGERLYACQLCEKLFSSKTDGIIHEKTCMGRKIRKIEGNPPTFECKVCSSRFTDLSSAWYHAKNMHLVDSEKPHKCPYCPRSYFNRKDLSRHAEKCQSHNDDTDSDVICVAATSASSSNSCVVNGREESVYVIVNQASLVDKVRTPAVISPDVSKQLSLDDQLELTVVEVTDVEIVEKGDIEIQMKSSS